MCAFSGYCKKLRKHTLKRKNARMSLIWLYRPYRNDHRAHQYLVLPISSGFIHLSKNLFRERLKANPEDSRTRSVFPFNCSRKKPLGFQIQYYYIRSFIQLSRFSVTYILFITKHQPSKRSAYSSFRQTSLGPRFSLNSFGIAIQ